MLLRRLVIPSVAMSAARSGAHPHNRCAGTKHGCQSAGGQQDRGPDVKTVEWLVNGQTFWVLSAALATPSPLSGPLKVPTVW